MTFARLAAILLLVAAVLGSPLAAAQDGATASGVSYHGGAKQAGEAFAYYLADEVTEGEALPNPLDPAAPPGTSSVIGLEIKAGHVDALMVEQRIILLAGDQGEVVDPREAEPAPKRTVLDHAKGHLVAQQAQYQLHLLPAAPDGTISFVGRSDAGRYEALDSLAIGPGRFGEAQAVDPSEPRDPADPEFWRLVRDSPVLVNTDESGQQDLTFTGDLVLEAVGLTIEASDDDESASLESGMWTTDTVPGAVQEQRRALLRMYLTDATVRISVQGGAPGLQFAGPVVVSEQEGESTLLGVTGTLMRDGEPSTFSDDRVLLPAGNTLALADAAPGGRFTLGITPTATAPATVAGGALAESVRSAWIALVAVLALAVAVGLGLLRHATQPVDLAAVEAAIEAQRYGRAARLAKRILRARPGLEDAVLGRAIALSKAGRAGAAISELHDHLRTRGATDGSLHYVLGLAFLDVGRMEDGRAALQQAVRLTPALASDVAARLGPQRSSTVQSTSLREVHGYA